MKTKTLLFVLLSLIFIPYASNSQGIQTSLSQKDQFQLPVFPEYHAECTRDAGPDSWESALSQTRGSMKTSRVASTLSYMDSSCHWTWDTLANTWIPESKYIYTYYANGLEASLEIKNWNGTSWIESILDVYSYDPNDNLISQLRSSWSGSTWIFSTEYVLTYDTSNNLTYQLYQIWNTGGPGWENHFQDFNTYNASNLRTMNLRQLWQAGAWVNSTQDLTTYDSLNDRVSNLTRLWDGFSWVDSWQLLNTFDANHNIVSLTQQNWNGSGWENGSRTLFAYDMNNHIISTMVQLWNAGVWENNWQQINTYTSNNWTGTMLQNWNGSTWIDDGQITNAYDSYNNFTSSTFQKWNGLAWVNSDSIYYYWTVSPAATWYVNPKQDMFIYPNPATSLLKIYNQDLSGGKMQVFDIVGAEVTDIQQITIADFELDITGLKQGIYTLVFTDRYGKQVPMKFIKQ